MLQSENDSHHSHRKSWTFGPAWAVAVVFQCLLLPFWWFCFSFWMQRSAMIFSVCFTVYLIEYMFCSPQNTRPVYIICSVCSEYTHRERVFSNKKRQRADTLWGRRGWADCWFLILFVTTVLMSACYDCTHDIKAHTEWIFYQEAQGFTFHISNCNFRNTYFIQIRLEEILMCDGTTDSLMKWNR